MKHRHLAIENYSRQSIDDFISRGKWADWIELRDKALSEPRILEDIAHICNHYISDPYEQRYHFWMSYVTKRLSNN